MFNLTLVCYIASDLNWNFKGNMLVIKLKRSHERTNADTVDCDDLTALI